MDKEKFADIVFEEFSKFEPKEVYPDNWKEVKKELVEIIENIDEAHEVYEMENDNA